jgi:hypothetical protein
MSNDYEAQSEVRLADSLMETLAVLSDFQNMHDHELYMNALEILNNQFVATQNPAIHYAFHTMFMHGYHFGLVRPEEVAHLETATTEL